MIEEGVRCMNSVREHTKDKSAVISDCTKIFIERPSDLLARVQMWGEL